MSNETPTKEKHTTADWEQAWRDFHASFKRLRRMAEDEQSEVTVSVKYKVGGLRKKS